MLPDPSDVVALVLHVLVCVGVMVAWVVRLQARSLGAMLRVIAGSLAVGLLLSLVSAPGPVPASGFALLLAWSWTLGIVLPLLLGIAGAVLLLDRRGAGWGLLAASLAVLAPTVHAFAIEPHDLEVTRHEIVSHRVRAPLRIAVIADLQTDAPGAYEERVLRAVMAEAPDVIVMPGDFVQLRDASAYAAAWDVLSDSMARVGWSAPLGVLATRGDVDPPPRWDRHVTRAGLQILHGRRELRSDVAIVGLELAESAIPFDLVRVDDRFTIVAGHRPDFALGRVDADLLLAGHTHGGQVRLPWIGPLVTLSNIPRAWAAGRTEVDDDTTLIVSRGVGMERADAPRLRFGCRPQIVIVDVVPAGS